MFTKLPPKMSIFKEGSNANLSCEMKAPSDSVIYWTLKRENAQECLVLGSDTLDFSLSSSLNIPSCNTTAVVDKAKNLIDDTF